MPTQAPTQAPAQTSNATTREKIASNETIPAPTQKTQSPGYTIPLTIAGIAAIAIIRKRKR
jgi:hypothetical protein